MNINSNNRKKYKQKHLKLPNGFGSITYLGVNRRRAFLVQAPAIINKDKKVVREILGYVENWEDGYRILLDYHKNPYYLEEKEKNKITLGEVFNQLKEKLGKEIGKKGMSKSNYKNLVYSYKYCEKYADVPIVKINYKIMQDTIDTCGCSKTTQSYIKNLLNRILNYAMLELEINVNVDISKKLSVTKTEKVTEHTSLNRNEINKLWESLPNNDIELALILVYTGLRPQELIDIEIRNVFINDGYMIGGCKTEAGKDRIIPIHNDILDLVKKRLLCNGTYLIETITNKKVSYKTLAKKWYNAMKIIGSNHYPYDARHTFATILDEYRLINPNAIIDDFYIKVLIGHTVSDVTKAVYTHRNDKKWLIEALNQVEFR